MTDNARARRRATRVRSLANLIKAWIGERAKAASVMTQEFNVRRQRQQAGHPARQTDIRITRAQVLSCTAHASKEDIVVRQARRE
jgi:hypothetical protein